MPLRKAPAVLWPYPLASAKGVVVINRYTRPAMGAIWELQNKFSIWKEIEVLACEAQAEGLC